MHTIEWRQKGIYLLIALSLVLTAGIPFLPAAASPGQATFYSSASDGCFDMHGITYFDAHGASLGIVHNDTTWVQVGQEWDGSNFTIWRGALFFDTSSLPDHATISSAVLSLHSHITYENVHFSINVVDGSGLNEPPQDVDYGYLGGQNVSGGGFHVYGYNSSGWYNVPLNETGIGWISKTGITKFGLRSSRDIAAIAPTGPEWLTVCASELGEGYQPRLVVTYTTLPVGGEAYPVSKISLLAPWIALLAAIFAGISLLVLRHRYS